MRSLFVKIFVNFWLALIFAGFLVFFLAPHLRGSDPARAVADRWRSELLPRHAEAIAAQFAKAGAGGVDAYLVEVERRTGVRLFLVPADPELTSRHPPADVARYARHAEWHPTWPFGRHRAPSYVAQQMSLGGREPVMLVADLFPPLAPSGRLAPPMHRRPAILLAALLVSSGALCFVVARSLTRPIRALQHATREMAAGNLDARVGIDGDGRGDELAALARDFDHMAERIQNLRTAEQRLLRDVSHELRSPLARMQVALELARQSPGEPAVEALDRIELEAERLNDIIGQLLALVRESAGEGERDSTPVDVSELVREVVADAAYEGAPRGVRVELIAPDTCIVPGDALQLRSALENVVRNAVFYTPDSSTVEVQVIAEPAAAVVRVRDRGPGVPEDALQAVFRPFFRVAEARERDSGGAGLGLAIAARAVANHGGSIDARNDPAGGLCVTIRLPLAA